MTQQRHLTWVAALATFLTTFSLSPLFEKQSWILSALLLIGLVAAVGYALRALGLPFYAVALLQIVAAGALLVYQFGPSGTLWYGLPTWDTVRGLNDVGLSGRRTITQYATPVPVEDGVILLTLSGIAGVAVAVDMIAVGLRLVPLAGLPLLALYTVPVAVARDGVPWLFFVLAAGAYVGLLVAEGRERLAHWGRSMGFTEQETELHQFVGDVQTGPIARVGRRIGAAAVCLAVAVPVVIPGLDESLFGNGFGNGGSGGRTVVTSNPILDLQRDLRRPEDVEIFSYETDDPSPDYWRMTTLNIFTGEQWERAGDSNIPDENVATESMPAAEGVAADVARTDRTTSVQIAQRFESRWLPLPYPVTSLAIDGGRWVYDEDSSNVFGVEQNTAGLDYQVTSVDLDFASVPAGDDVPGSIEDYVDLPDDLPARLGELADQVTVDATTPYEQAAALQAWFRSPSEFSYTLDAPDGHSTNDLLAFLTDREGYCEQFAATMALMARHLGIPARVDVGFLPGTRSAAGSWAVSTHDAHAWPELYFEGLGWVRFEPTPASRTGTAPDWTVAAAAPYPTTAPTTPGATTGGATAAPSAGGDEEGGAAASGSGDGFTFPTVPVLIVLGALLLLALPMLLRAAMTRRRWGRASTPNEVVLAGWDLLRDRASDLGYDWTGSDTPRTLAASLHEAAGLAGDPADALRRLARGTERALYAPHREDLQVSSDRVREDVDMVTTALTTAVPRARQWRARFLPGSTRRVVHDLSERVADLLDWLEGLGEQVRLAVRRRSRTTG